MKTYIIVFMNETGATFVENVQAKDEKGARRQALDLSDANNWGIVRITEA